MFIVEFRNTQVADTKNARITNENNKNRQNYVYPATIK
jgi:hypothetical protein